MGGSKRARKGRGLSPAGSLPNACQHARNGLGQTESRSQKLPKFLVAGIKLFELSLAASLVSGIKLISNLEFKLNHSNMGRGKSSSVVAAIINPPVKV